MPGHHGYILKGRTPFSLPPPIKISSEHPFNPSLIEGIFFAGCA
jgi:hypothetical protein